ncbi:MAG: FAD-dependent oxidoreductase [Firmicutes bacterium]|nr:FAD-dependent oxidoreductase [Bacillota bacterium]
MKKKYDVVVVGGGLSGLCAAVACARHGAKTALIHNRPVLGGNASSEIRMHICGADFHETRTDARETGIVEEILLENRVRNPQYSYSEFDTVLWEKAHFQDGLDLYLNTHMHCATVEENTIKSIKAHQLTTEKNFTFDGEIFIDATGDATLAYLAGAEYMSGREGKDVYGEKYAPDKSDKHTMGSTLLFSTKDMGKPMPFTKPFWANSYTEEDLKYRGHGASGKNYWWIELGGDKFDTISDSEEIRDELLKAVYGVWDHVKNGGEHGADNFVLDWVGFLPGKRESRRVLGDYVLKEQDLLEGRIFEDAVAYGGWSMDMHVVGGIGATEKPPTKNIFMDNVYTIPYRSLYSKNIHNLMIGGRAISASHMAFGSTRVIATCAVIGQAIGTGAAMAVEKGITPRELCADISDLQRRLSKDDCYIPGYKNTDQKDLALKATVSCSSALDGYKCDDIVNGYPRKVKDNENCWVSDEIKDKPEWVFLKYEQPVSPREIQLRLDSNLSKELSISMFDNALSRQVPGIPAKLVKDYCIECFLGDKLVHSITVENNYLRFKRHFIDGDIKCDAIKISFLSTNGDKNARLFEVRVY